MRRGVKTRARQAPTRVAAPEQPPVDPGADYGRAGRNLPVSIAVGVTLGIGTLVPLFFAKDFFPVVLILYAGFGVWEMVRAVRARDAKLPLLPMLAGSVVITLLAWYGGPMGLSAGLVITVLAMMVWRMFYGASGYLRDVGAAALITIYVPSFLALGALIVPPDDGAQRALLTLSAIALTDTGGYAAGVLFGKHIMVPSISPKKSWEGVAGSVVVTSAGSAVLMWALLHVHPWKGAVFGVVISAMAVLGDLVESLIKRDLGVKDMSNLLPGHGGMMDRLDSILFAAPIAYLLLSVLAPTG